jgi:pilus assembly protein Flp/PilA
MLLKQWVLAREELERFSKSRRGATAIEYGLIAAGVAIVIATAMTVLSPELEKIFGRITDALKK